MSLLLIECLPYGICISFSLFIKLSFFKKFLSCLSILGISIPSNFFIFLFDNDKSLFLLAPSLPLINFDFSKLGFLISRYFAIFEKNSNFDNL